MLDEDFASATLGQVKSDINSAFDAHPDVANALYPTSDQTFRELGLYRNFNGCGPWTSEGDYEFRSADCQVNFDSITCAYKITVDDAFLTATRELLSYMKQINKPTLFGEWVDELRMFWTAPPDPSFPQCSD